MATVREQIRRKVDEAPCDQCGELIVVGQMARVDLRRGTIYCSRVCASRNSEPAQAQQFDIGGEG